MPLKAGKGQKTISSNISELHKGKTYAKTEAKFGKKKADDQAVAIAMDKAGMAKKMPAKKMKKKTMPKHSKSQMAMAKKMGVTI